MIRLRLFDWLSRLISARPGSRDARSGRKRGGSRAGEHRKGAEPSPRNARPPADPPPSHWPPLSRGVPASRGVAASRGTAASHQGPEDGAALGYAAGRPGSQPGTTARAAPAGGGGAGRARIREAPYGPAPVTSLAFAQETPASARPPAPRQPWYQVVPPPTRQAPGQARTAAADSDSGVSAAGAAPPAGHERPRDPRMPDVPFTGPHPDGIHRADGRANCGPLERILWRQWDETCPPPPQAVAAVETLASFPRALQEKLAGGLDGIYVGAGGVPDLDHMTGLRGVPLPSGRATWDACAGAYGERKIVVGSRPSPTPDVMCHEVGHALDDLDSPPGHWQSDSPAFRLIYDECQPHIASDFHRQRGGLGRKEFFADAFAAIASGQRPVLVDMLGGNTRCALTVMLYFNRRYGI